jgi:magnesium-protoporphyrin IX monomethyl ester (oxidative) cyclase
MLQTFSVRASPLVGSASSVNSQARRARVAVRASQAVSEEGFEMMRKGVKVAAEETVLTPRFYTTDFDEMADLFDLEKNPNLRMDELEAMLNEFRRDYNQTHFVRNDTFKAAADKITGPTRKIFVEFLERSCTAEFSGFLLYKELGRRLKDSNPVVAEIFTLLSRDEARHAGFINKALSDFNLALDLGFLTKNRTYTFFKPKFIVYATYLSEKIGYWRYISIYRHLQRNPDNQLYPMFEYFENWCQDESRHGDFLAAVLKARPELLNDFQARMWSRFFCLSVYITMYLNDHQRTAFYESLGLNTTQFNQHVIIETNRTTERIFPEVPDVENPEFFKILDKMVKHNENIVAIGKSDAPDFLKTLQKLPSILGIVSGCFALFFGPQKRVGSADVEAEMALEY